jgi:serine/threonine protein kinase
VGFENYQLLEKIGEGGMATVHRARQRGIGGFDRIVAVKQLHGHLSERPDFVARFIREARIASALSHANIVQTYDFGHSEAGHYIVMEYLEGWSLIHLFASVVAAGIAMPIPVVLSLLHELCDALDHVHTRSGQEGEALAIVHRDVSLGNLFVTRSGHLKLIDFGVATARGLPDADDDTVAGKPSYMAPEILRGQTADARGDMFAVGVVAWSLITGKRAFSARDTIETIREVLRVTLPPPSRHRSDCPVMLDQIVLEAVATNPEERMPSAAAMRDRLEVVMSLYGVGVRPSAVSRWIEDTSLFGRRAADSTAVAARLSTDDLPRPPSTSHDQRLPTAEPMRHVSWLRVTLVAALVIAVVLAVVALPAASSTPASAATAPPPRQPLIVMTSLAEPPPLPVIELPQPRRSETVRIEPPTSPVPAAAPVASRRTQRASSPSRIHATSSESVFEAPADATPLQASAPADTTALPSPPAAIGRVQASQRLEPIVIPPDRVRALSGQIGHVDLRRLEHEGVGRRFSAILCIDTRGAVASVKLLGDAPEWLRDALVHDLRTFRFTPYRVDDEPRPACFVRRLLID